MIIGGVLAVSANGTTAAALSKSLHLDLKPADVPAAYHACLQDLNLAGLKTHSRLWGQLTYRFQRTYLDTVAGRFNASLQAFDFLNLGGQSAAPLNQWINASGADDLAAPVDFVTSVDQKSRVMFSNAVAIHETFDTGAAPTDIVDGLFEDEAGKQFLISMLRRIETVPYYENTSYKAAQIAIGPGSLALLVIMPANNQFGAVEADLVNVIAEIDQYRQPEKIEFTLPLFEVRTYSDIGKSIPTDEKLTAQVVDVCDTNNVCTKQPVAIDFSTVNGLGFLIGDRFVSQSKITVQGTGVTAASASMTELEATSDEPASLFSPGSGFGNVSISFNDVICNPVPLHVGPAQARPFLFVIRDTHSGTIVQLGRIKTVPAETVGPDVCQQNQLNFDDAIWPTVP